MPCAAISSFLLLLLLHHHHHRRRRRRRHHHHHCHRHRHHYLYGMVTFRLCGLSAENQRMAWLHFSVILLTSPAVLQLVTGGCLVIGDLTEQSASDTGVSCRLFRSTRSATVKRPAVDDHIRRLWLSRGATSSIMNNQLRELLDSDVDLDAVELLGRDIENTVEGTRSMRYGR